MAITSAVLREHWRTGLPVYRAGMVPEELATRRQLRAAGLSAAGLSPAAHLHYTAYHNVCDLYRVADARPIRPLTERQRQALADGRKLANTLPCPRCGQARVSVRAGSQWCEDCRPAAEAEAYAAIMRRQRAADEAHALMLGEDRAAASRWAAGVLADEHAAYLDTETTGLGEDYIVEIAILDHSGRPLVNTLVNPGIPIPDDARAIHGIGDADVRDAPAFADIWPQVRAAVEGKRLIIFNSAYDTAILFYELDRYYNRTIPQLGPAGDPWQRHPAAIAEADRLTARAECAMHMYARWAGEWSDYWGDYRWLPLNGGHRAAADCAAVLGLLRTMAAGADSPQEGQDQHAAEAAAP